MSELGSDPSFSPVTLSDTETWEFSDKSDSRFAEVHLAATQQSEKEKTGFIRKTILKTGEFPAIPTKGGLINKPLRIVKDGLSDASKGIISMEELKENFYANAVPNVQIPLSDDQDDHKNITAVNTGYVRGLNIEPDEDEDGEFTLVADMEFTEPEVEEKVLRGTYADVSSGIPWRLRSRGKDYGACLEHVAITNRPFIPGLGPFLAASDQVAEAQAQILHFAGATVEVPMTDLTPPPQVEDNKDQKPEPPSPVEVSPEVQRQLITEALVSQLGLSLDDYTVDGVESDNVTIKHTVVNNSWKVPFETKETGIKLASIDKWSLTQEENKETSAEDKAVEPPVRTELSDLDNARRLREIRFSEGNSNTTREVNMTLSREELERLELSDAQREALTPLIDEVSTLRSKSREADADRRVAELSDMGFKEKPGALKLYRRVFLADDEAPAAVLLADSDGNKKEQVTATEILDKFIDAIKGEENKVVLSDQALLKDDDEKPKDNADGEVETPFEERLAAGRAAIGRS